MTILSLLMMSVIGGIFYFVMSLEQLVTFSIGMFLGWLLIFVDSVYFYQFYNEKGRQFKNIMTLSLLFVIIYVLMTFYLFFTSFNILGLGMMVGLNLTVSLNLLKYKSSPRSLDLILNTKNPLTKKEAEMISLAFVSFFSLFVILLFIRYGLASF